MRRGTESLVGLKREGEGKERVIILVRVQLGWKDRGWERSRKEEGHPLKLQDFTSGYVRAGVWTR